MAKYQRGTFITVPNNHALSGLSSESQTVFMWICFHSDEYGRCFPSRTTLANEAGCSVRTVDNAIETLINKGILLKKTRKDGKKNLTSIYQIMIIEKEEIDDFDGGVVQEVHEGSAGGALGVVQEVQRELNPLELNSIKIKENEFSIDFDTFCEENNYIFGEYYFKDLERDENGYSHPSRKQPFTIDEVKSKYNKFIKLQSNTGRVFEKPVFYFDEELRKLKDSNFKTNKIIAHIWVHKGYRFENAEQMQAQFSIDSSWASKLKGYSGSQVEKAIQKCKQESEELGYEWKASTVVKKISEIQ